MLAMALARMMVVTCVEKPSQLLLHASGGQVRGRRPLACLVAAQARFSALRAASLMHQPRCCISHAAAPATPSPAQPPNLLATSRAPPAAPAAPQSDDMLLVNKAVVLVVAVEPPTEQMQVAMGKHMRALGVSTGMLLCCEEQALSKKAVRFSGGGAIVEQRLVAEVLVREPDGDLACSCLMVAPAGAR
jgi:hypothetical protein